jgi:hypothetical protein
MSGVRRIILGVLGVHLILSVVGAGQIRLPKMPNWLGRGLEVYASLTGAANTYSFFAPGVGTELRPTFEIVKKDGRHTSVGFAESSDREVRLRLIKIITTFWDEISEPTMRRALAASLSGKVLAQYPGAQSIALRLDEYELPDMKTYAKGERPRWDLFYQAKFARRLAATRGEP